MRSSRAATLACALFAAAVARADDAHYQNFILGERAEGLGGAFTAIADDPSGTYYNPAGLVWAKSDILSANLSIYGFQQQSLQNAFRSQAGGLFNDVKDSVGSAFQQLNTVPGMTGTAYGIGRADDDGHFRQVWALSVMVPDDTSSYTLNYVVDQNGNLQSLANNISDQTALVGIGYSLRLFPDWSAGVSLNGLYRSISETSRSITATDAVPGPSLQYFEDDISLKLTVIGIYAQAGVMWRPVPNLSLGFTIASPSMTVFSSGSTDEVQVSTAGLTETNLQNLNGNTRWPAHGRVGAAYRTLADRLVVSADLSLWGYTAYQLVNSSPAGGLLPNFVNDIQREVTWNVDVGAEYTIAGRFPIRAGFFTNRSSAPSIDSGTEAQLDNVDLYGATLGFTIPGKATETTFGATFSFGQGQSKSPTADNALSALSYAAGPSNQFFFDFFLGGSHAF